LGRHAGLGHKSQADACCTQASKMIIRPDAGSQAFPPESNQQPKQIDVQCMHNQCHAANAAVTNPLPPVADLHGKWICPK